MAQDIFC